MAKRKVILDEVNPEVCGNFESRGWLPVLDVEHTPPAALIREFYSNLSIHSDDSNIHYVKTWIRGEEFDITYEVAAFTLDVPLVQQPVYPYTKFPSIDDVMSLLIGTTISWGTNPRITTHELTELNYLFFRISCHSIWPISYIHTIPIERCAFLYAFITDAPISFPILFICSLVEVHRSSAKSHSLFFLVFIYRILLDLGLEDFPTSELVHIIAPISVTFLKQRVAQLKASSKHPRVKSSIGDASRGPPFGDPIVKEFVDPTTVVDPPPSTSTSSSMRTMLETCLIVQAAHGQLLLDLLNEVAALRAKLVDTRGASPPAPPSNQT